MNVTKENWDLEIRPKTAIFDLRIRELWYYRDLMWLFVRRDFVAQFKQTILGPLWHIIQPILNTMMFLLVFGKIAKLPNDDTTPVLFYMSGITIWSYFSICLTNTSNTFVSNAAIFGKVYFPRLILPISVVISNIVKFGIQFSILFVTIVWFSFQGVPIMISARWLFIPVLVILMAGIGLGLGIIISSFTTKYRDFSVLLVFAIQLGMYITPIAYPLSFLAGSKYRWIIMINPLTQIVECFRWALFGKLNFEVSSLWYSFFFMVISLLIGSIFFNKVEKTFMDTV